LHWLNLNCASIIGRSFIFSTTLMNDQSLSYLNRMKKQSEIIHISNIKIYPHCQNIYMCKTHANQKVTNKIAIILCYFSSLFLEIISSYYLNFCHKLSPFLQGWQRRKKRFVHLKQKTNICCIALFWPVIHDCLMTDSMLIEISQNFSFVCLFCF
jgi:hypothetical protein